MNTIKYRSISVLLMSLICASACQADSIWAKKNANKKALYADDKAIQIGDVLTIIVNEDHKVDNKVKRDLEKTTDHSLLWDGQKSGIQYIMPTTPTVSLDAQSSKKINGKADYKDERSIEDRITVVVEDIHPNGNLVIIGTRSREINEDKQTIQVSGIVRPSDITYDNTIRSDQVANFQLVTISDGPSKDYNNPGWFSKFLDFIWPF